MIWLGYLEIDETLAHGLAHEPCLCHVPKHGRRQTEEDDKEVGHRQVHDKDIGHRAHRVIRVHGYAHQRVAHLQELDRAEDRVNIDNQMIRQSEQGPQQSITHQSHEKDDRVRADEYPLGYTGINVVLQHLQVLVVS